MLIIIMLYINSITSLLELLILIACVLFIVAFITVAERKIMASMQRILGPNIIGFYVSAFMSISLLYNNLETDVKVNKFKIIKSKINYLDYFILFLLIIIFTYLFKYTGNFYNITINLPSIVNSIKTISIHITEVEFFQISYFNLVGLLIFPSSIYLIYILRNYIKKVILYYYNNNISMGLKIAFYLFILLLFMLNIFLDSLEEIHDFLMINLIIIMGLFGDISLFGDILLFTDNCLYFDVCTYEEDPIFDPYFENDNVKYMVPSSSGSNNNDPYVAGGTTNNLGIGNAGLLKDIVREESTPLIGEANKRWELTFLALKMHSGKYNQQDLNNIKQRMHNLDMLTTHLDSRFPLEKISHSRCYKPNGTIRQYNPMKGWVDNRYPKPNITENTPQNLINYIAYKFRPINRSLIFNRPGNRFRILEKYTLNGTNKFPMPGDVKGLGFWFDCQWDRLIDTDIATGELKQVTFEDIKNKFVHHEITTNQFLCTIRCFYPNIRMNDPITTDMIETLKSFNPDRNTRIAINLLVWIRQFQDSGTKSYNEKDC